VDSVALALSLSVIGLPYGRLAQSIAFFNAPGIERLYSGVTKSTASTATMAFLNSVAMGG